MHQAFYQDACFFGDFIHVKNMRHEFILHINHERLSILAADAISACDGRGRHGNSLLIVADNFTVLKFPHQVKEYPYAKNDKISTL